MKISNYLVIFVFILLVGSFSIFLFKGNIFSFIYGEEDYVDIDLSGANRNCVQSGDIITCENDVWDWTIKNNGDGTHLFDNIGNVIISIDSISFYNTFNLGPYASSFVFNGYVKLFYKKNFYNHDIILNFDDVEEPSGLLSGGSCMYDGNEINILINDEKINIKPYIVNRRYFEYNKCKSDVDNNFYIKILKDIENPNIIGIYYNDEWIKNMTLVNDSLILGLYSGSITKLKLIRLRIRESCEQGIKVDQVFRGEQLVGINDLKYDNVKFCQSIPSLELRNGIFQQNYDINDILLSNGVVVVTEGNIIQVNYFIDNIGQFAIECTEDNQISECYDDVQGFLHICSEGVWDNLEGKCTEMNTPNFCKKQEGEITIFGRYDIEQKKCYYNQPQGDICLVGQYDGNKKCVWEPDCDKYEFNLIDGECCGSEYPAFNPFTGKCEEFITDLNDTDDGDDDIDDDDDDGDDDIDDDDDDGDDVDDGDIKEKNFIQKVISYVKNVYENIINYLKEAF